MIGLALLWLSVLFHIGLLNYSSHFLPGAAVSVLLFLLKLMAEIDLSRGCDR